MNFQVSIKPMELSGNVNNDDASPQWTIIWPLKYSVWRLLQHRKLHIIVDK